DHVYGSDGYFVVKGTGGNNHGVDSSLPSYVATADYTGAGTYAAGAYPAWDDPTVTPGPSVPNRYYGLFYGSTSPLRFTLAAARKFVLMIPVGGDWAGHYPTSLT